ncbi:MAG: ABC-2 type transport system ATP-binding protein [Planctomycetota bacterium]|jgi:ABC-2 type transport system ATP-binding protein
MSAVLTCKDLGRWYGEVVGLNDLSLEIGSGITGLIGPNGAGKSTFLKLVAGELRPSRGSVQVLGLTPFANQELYRRIGFCPQQDALYEGMSGLEFVSFLMRLAGFSRAESKSRAWSALEKVDLIEAAKRSVKTYSKGMRQRARLAQAIAHDPEFLIVDEPLTGLDPIARESLTTLFKQLATDGMSILLSSHILHEVESMTSEIALLHRGRLLAQGDVMKVRDLISKHPRRIEFEARDTRRLAGALVELQMVSSIQILPAEKRLRVETSDSGGFFGALTPIVASGAFGISAMECADEDLESVFDYLVG